jgi:hypothetical protein
MTARRVVFIYLCWPLPSENNRKSVTFISPIIKCVKIIGPKERRKSSLFAMLRTKSWSVGDLTWGNFRCGIGPGIILSWTICWRPWRTFVAMLYSFSGTGESHSVHFNSFHRLQREARNLDDIVWSSQLKNMCFTLLCAFTFISDWLRAGRPGEAGVRVPVGNFHFSISSRPALGSTQPPTKWVPRALSRG